MSSESPWRTLAERLGVLWPIHGLSNGDRQDLLIGRARRVVAESLAANDELFTEQIEELLLSLCNSVGTTAAIAALELLDAVGHEP